jgi:hypothetical protein
MEHSTQANTYIAFAFNIMRSLELFFLYGSLYLLLYYNIILYCQSFALYYPNSWNNLGSGMQETDKLFWIPLRKENPMDC